MITSPSPSEKIQVMVGKVCLKCKGKTLLGIVNKFLKTKSLLTAMFCLIASSKFCRQWFEFSLKVKVMGSNPVYLLKSFLFLEGPKIWGCHFHYLELEIWISCSLLWVGNSNFKLRILILNIFFWRFWSRPYLETVFLYKEIKIGFKIFWATNHVKLQSTKGATKPLGSKMDVQIFNSDTFWFINNKSGKLQRSRVRQRRFEIPR